MDQKPALTLGFTHSLDPVQFSLKMANRHGLIAGATGTGKTVTLQTMVEGFSKFGVPVCVPDIKGDLAGLAAPGVLTPKIAQRFETLGASFEPEAASVVFWDFGGKSGHPLRTTVSEIGPLLMSKLLGLNETQEGVLSLAFHIADTEKLLLLDIEDLDSVLDWIEENIPALRAQYGTISPATLGTIKRKLIELKTGGGTHLFGEPALAIADLMRRTPDGRGIINIIDARSTVSDSRSYVAFLLWLLSELFEDLPEVGDLPVPKLVFFFDEAHLLFEDASSTLLEKIETVVRLVRSKGVGVYFVTQNPLDIPESVLGQLGNRVQHALRAFTPRDQKAVRAAAETFRERPGLDTTDVLTSLAVGEALVSLLDDDGRPSMVDRVYIVPPRSRLGSLTDDERRDVIARSPIGSTYDTVVDRESAAELLARRAERGSAEREEERPDETTGFKVPWGVIGSRVMTRFLTRLGASLTTAAIRGIMGTMKRRR